MCIRCVRLRASVSDGGFCEDALQTAGHEVLDHAAQEHVEREGQPEGVVADQRVAGVVDGEVGRRGPEHRVAHDARFGGSDHDAVHDEGHGRGDGDQDDPDDVVSRQLLDHRGVGRRGVHEHAHQVAPPDEVDAHENHRHERSPEDALPQAVAQRHAVAGADEPARERLRGVGEAVVHVGEEREQLQQQGVHGQQRGIAHAGRRPGEEGVDGHDAERAEDDVAVDDEKGFQGFEVQHLGPVDRGEQLPVFEREQQRREPHARPLGDDRGVGDAHDAHVHPECEPQAAKDVHDVDRDGRQHREDGVLHPREPAVEAEEDDARRYGPDAGVEIVAGHLAAVHGPQRQFAQRVLQQDHQHAHHGRHRQRPDQHVGAFAEVAGSERLGREAAGAHADERTVPVDEVEDRHADGQRADRGGGIGAPVPCDGRRDDAHEGYGDVRDDIGERDAQYFAVHGHNGCKDKAKAANLRSGSAFIFNSGTQCVVIPETCTIFAPTL